MNKSNTHSNRLKDMKTRDFENNGKLPPQNIELEEIVLGACLLEKEGMDIAISILTPESFYKENHKLIFEAAKSLHSRNEPVDIMTVTQELRSMEKLMEVGGGYYVSTLTNRVSSSANTEYHCRIIQQAFLKRELIRKSTELITECYDDSTDVFEIYDGHIKTLMNLEAGINQDKVKTLSEITSEQIEQIEKIKKGLGAVGLNTPFSELDKMIGGWYGGEFYIFAARPGMGKSILGKEISMVLAKQKKPVLVVNLEMNDSQSWHRIASGETEIPLYRIRNAEFEDYHMEQIRVHANILSNYPIYFQNHGGLNIIRLFRMVRKLIKEKSITMLIVDYLQLMDGDSGKGNREQEISQISRGLKLIAKEFNIPVIAFSQLSRKVEERTGKVPQLSDLRESGSLEQDADVVGFIHRPEQYGLPLIFDEQEFPSKGKGIVIIAKNRQGKTGEVLFDFNEKTASFLDPYKPKNERPSLLDSAPSALTQSNEF